MVSYASIYRDLVTVSEYVTFADTARILGTTQAHLKRVIDGKSTLKPEQASYLHDAAKRARRREGQLKHAAQAAETRRAKREIHDTLRKIGNANLKIPANLPPFLRYHETGKLGSPVYIYDFRQMSPTDVMQFFRFMKTINPGGYFFFTYELSMPGLSHEKDGTFFSDKLVAELKVHHKTNSVMRAILSEVGTAGAGANINRVKGGFVLQGVGYISTAWQPFCVLIGAGTCELLTDLEFYEVYSEYNDRSIGRRVLECGISYNRPLELSADEIAYDLSVGADPVTGLIYIWND